MIDHSVELTILSTINFVAPAFPLLGLACSVMARHQSRHYALLALAQPYALIEIFLRPADFLALRSPTATGRTA